MDCLKLKSKGNFVFYLQEMLQKLGYNDVACDGNFGPITYKAVLDFQKKNNLVVDGIVGVKTWNAIHASSKPKKYIANTETDIEKAAKLLGCEVAVIKAVNEVESGGRSGFLSNGKPIILFEGHIFWNELKKVGINPALHVQGNEDILYPTWTKQFYKGGIREYDRLEKAMQIHKDAALSAASYGKFQILGNNYALCGYKNVSSFVEDMKLNEGAHIMSFCNYIINRKLTEFLKNKNWAAFAKAYNGPAYAKNKYDVKLQEAYNRYKS